MREKLAPGELGPRGPRPRPHAPTPRRVPGPGSRGWGDPALAPGVGGAALGVAAAGGTRQDRGGARQEEPASGTWLEFGPRAPLRASFLGVAWEGVGRVAESSRSEVFSHSFPTV